MIMTKIYWLIPQYYSLQDRDIQEEGYTQKKHAMDDKKVGGFKNEEGDEPECLGQDSAGKHSCKNRLKHNVI